MNCRSFRKRMAELLDAGYNHTASTDMLEHIEACPECARELAESQAVIFALTPSSKAVVSTNLKERIMSKVDKLDSVSYAPRTSRLHKGIVRLALAAVLLAAVLAGSNLLSSRSGAGNTPAYQLLAQAVEAAESLRTLHIKAEMRTLPGDNFDLIEPEEEFVPIEIWATSGNTQKWRVEKTGRVVVMDGESTTQLIGVGEPNPLVYKVPQEATGFIGWLTPLLDVDSLLSREKDLAHNQGAKITMEKKNFSGAPKIVLTIQSKAQGDFSESGHRKNTSVLESDNVRVYTFDAVTHRLEGMEVYIDVEQSRTLVFKTTEIEYDEPLTASLFELDVPEDATWYKSPEDIAGTADNSSMTPEEAAKAIFQACAESDWDTLHSFAGTLADKPDFREYLGDLEIISVGKAFKSGMYPGWFVPYEIRLKNGEVKKYNLAIRNDNPKHQWELDGGI